MIEQYLKSRDKTPRSPASVWLVRFAVVTTLLLPVALAPPATAGPRDYRDFGYSLGARPYFGSQRGGFRSGQVDINISRTGVLNTNWNTPAIWRAGRPSGGLQPQQVFASYSWVGGFASGWNDNGNWTPGGGPPGPGDTAVFGSAFIGPNQPNLTTGVTVGTLHMATGINRNVTITGSSGATLNLSGLSEPLIGILVDNTSAFTLTITVALAIGRSQAWTNNSANLFTVSGGVSLDGNVLLVNGTGNTLVSGVIGGVTAGSALTKGGSGTLTLTGNNALFVGATTVNGGILEANATGGIRALGGTSGITVNAGGTLLTSTADQINHMAAMTLNGGTFNTGGTSQTLDGLTLQSSSTIDLGTGASILDFGGVSIRIDGLLTILNWSGSFSGGGADQITFANVLDPTFLSNIQFDGFAIGANQLGTGELIPIPEPSTWISALLAIAVLAVNQRRRLRKAIARR